MFTLQNLHFRIILLRNLSNFLKLSGILTYRKDRKGIDTAHFKKSSASIWRNLKKIIDSLKRTDIYGGYLLNASRVCYCSIQSLVISLAYCTILLLMLRGQNRFQVFGNKTSKKIFIPIREMLTGETYVTTRLLKLFSRRPNQEGRNARHGEMINKKNVKEK